MTAESDAPALTTSRWKGCWEVILTDWTREATGPEEDLFFLFPSPVKHWKKTHECGHERVQANVLQPDQGVRDSAFLLTQPVYTTFHLHRPETRGSRSDGSKITKYTYNSIRGEISPQTFTPSSLPKYLRVQCCFRLFPWLQIPTSINKFYPRETL